MYHSNFWEAGNTKDDNLKWLDKGGTKIMTCTTAFVQGINWLHIQYVVIFKLSYGLIVNNQMLEHVGRYGKELYIYFLIIGKNKAFKGSLTD